VYLQAGSKPDIPPADIIANRARGNPELVGCSRALTLLLLLFEASADLHSNNNKSSSRHLKSNSPIRGSPPCRIFSSDRNLPPAAPNSCVIFEVFVFR